MENTEKQITEKMGKVEIGDKIKENKEKILSDKVWDDLEGLPLEVKENLVETYSRPSKIQALAYPKVVSGKHICCQSHNGSGKTLAFSVPALARVKVDQSHIQVVIFEHTLEMIAQTYTRIKDITKNTKYTIGYIDKESKEIPSCQVLVTNVGQFNKYFFGRKGAKKDLVNKMHMFIFDEVDYIIEDETSDGFKTANKIVRTQKEGSVQSQFVFFSATITKDFVECVDKLFGEIEVIRVKDSDLTLDNIKQCYHVTDNKIDFLCKYLDLSQNTERMIIFVNTKEEVKEIRLRLKNKGFNPFVLMGGEMTPEERKKTIYHFNRGDIQVLITTNVLARGFDEQMVKLIINYDLPVTKNETTQEFESDNENYLHRIGRTGRFGNEGLALNLVKGEKERKYIDQIKAFYSSEMDEIKNEEELANRFKKTLENYK